MFLLSVVCNQTYHSENKYFRWDDADVRFALYIVPTCLILFYSASSLKQPVSRHIAPLRHISLIPSQASLCCYSIILRALTAEKLQISLISVYERERWRVKQYTFLSTLTFVIYRHPVTLFTRDADWHKLVTDLFYDFVSIKPNSVRIRFLSCQFFVLPSTGFELTPLIHCSTIFA